MKLTEIKEVIKASPAIQIESKITLLQRRMWNVLLANAYNELPDKEIHHVSVSELAEKIGFDSTNRVYLKETLEALVNFTVKWNVLEKDKEQEWGAASLLAYATIKNGICTYGFPLPLRLKLYNPRIYAKLNLRLQNRFSSKHSLVLWEVCFDYFDIARKQGETSFIPIETFRELMGIEVDEYRTFKSLNQLIIKPAVREINKETGYFVEVKQKRVGRKVAFLKFLISQPLEISSTMKMELADLNIHDLPPIALELVQAGVSRKEALRIGNQEWDTVDPAALPEDRDDFAVYVEEKIGLAQHATDVKNAGGFIVKAIHENYQNPVFKKQLQAEKAEEKQAMLASLRDEMLEKQNALIRQAVRANPELIDQAASKITSSFVRDRLIEYDSINDAYGAGGMIAGEINSILAKEHCADLIAPVIATYEDEKARILGKVG